MHIVGYACIQLSISRYILGFNSTVYYIYQLLLILIFSMLYKIKFLCYIIIAKLGVYILFKIWQNLHESNFKGFGCINTIPLRCKILPKADKWHPYWGRPGYLQEYRSPKLSDASPTPDRPSAQSIHVYMVLCSQSMISYIQYYIRELALSLVSIYLWLNMIMRGTCSRCVDLR